MSDTMKKVVRFGSLLLGVILIVAFVLRGVSAYHSYKTSMSNGDLSIAEYQKELLVQTAKLEEQQASLSEKQAHLHNMQDVGNKVANLQNELANKVDLYGVSQDVLWNNITSDLASIQSDLLEYFDESDVFVWYDWDTVKHPLLRWKCVTTYDVVGEQIEAMWVCMEQDVMAYATAIYDVETGRFSDLQTYVTDAGMKYLVQAGGETE